MNAAALEQPSPEQARVYRDGLMVAVLAARPLRLRSFSLIQVRRDLTFNNDVFVLSVPREHTKTTRAIEFSLPRSLTDPLTTYLQRYRRMLPGADRHEGLWASTSGGPLVAGAIYRIICERTKRALGFPINPHLFREIAATTIARDCPQGILIARDILTHVNLITTSRHYIQSRTLDAAREHVQILEILRK